MLEQIIRIIFFAIFSLVQAYIIKKITCSEAKIFTIHNIIALLILVVSNSLTYRIEYSIYFIILRVLISIIVYQQIFRESLYRMIIAYIFNIMIITIIDLIVYFPFINLSGEVYRNTWYYIITTNSLVAIFSILLIKYTKITKIMQDFIKSIKAEQQNILIIFYSLAFITIITIFYKITNLYNFNYEFWINISIISILLILSLIFVRDKMQYNSLLNEHDVLQNYYKEFEDILDDIKINNHEYKNQLAIIENYIMEKEYGKALKAIRNLDNNKYEYDKLIITELKNISNSEIKSLLYYKLIIAKKSKLNISVNIGQGVSTRFKKLNSVEVKVLSRLIGIYLDNAIEASKESSKKLLSVEIYMIDKKLYFTFANSYNIKKYNSSMIGKKGYTTKGMGHGNGIYLANKILERNNWISAKTNNVNKMYIQQLIIKKDR